MNSARFGRAVAKTMHIYFLLYFWICGLTYAGWKLYELMRPVKHSVPSAFV